MATRRSRRQGVDNRGTGEARAERLVQLEEISVGRQAERSHQELPDWRPPRTSAESPSHRWAFHFVLVGRGQVHEQHQAEHLLTVCWTTMQPLEPSFKSPISLPTGSSLLRLTLQFVWAASWRWKALPGIRGIVVGDFFKVGCPNYRSKCQKSRRQPNHFSSH